MPVSAARVFERHEMQVSLVQPNTIFGVFRAHPLRKCVSRLDQEELAIFIPHADARARAVAANSEQKPRHVPHIVHTVLHPMRKNHRAFWGIRPRICTRARRLAVYKRAEERWAKRCLWACMWFIMALVVAISVSVVYKLETKI